MMTSTGSLSRRGLFQASGIGLAAVVTGPALAACSRTQDNVTLDSLREQGFVRAAINNEVPFGYIGDDGQVTGSSPEVLRAVFAELGVDEVRAESVAWDGLIPGLKANRFDVVASGMYITSERCAEVAFAEPDYRILQAFMVPAGNPHGLATFDDIAANPDVKVAVLNASVEKGYAEGAGVPADQIETVDNQVTAYELLKNGRVEAVGLSTISLNRIQEQHGGDFEVTEGFIPAVNGEEVNPAGALAFRQSDTEILAEVNRVLAEFKENGRLLEIIEPFGFTEDELPGDLTTEQLCQG